MTHVSDVTDEDFEARVIHAGKPVMVDFWADWCAPCKAMTPHLESLAREYRDDLDVYKLDIVSNAKTKDRFDIRSIPTILVFRNGEVIETVRGRKTLSELTKIAENILA
jgi:thioredoxin